MSPRLTLLPLLLAFSVSAQTKKFIEVGWDCPDTTFLRQHHQQMQAEAPFDGVMLQVDLKTPEGTRIRSDWAWDNTAWKREHLRPALADLQACKLTRFTDNFIRINASPGTLAWDDEAGWKNLAEKLGSCAWLTHEAGLKGLIFDPESYGTKQFRFDPQKGRTFDQAVDLARKRGVQVMRAIAAEHPDCTLLAFWLNSINIKAGAADNSRDILIVEDYGLLPAFINGLLDAMPGTMTLIDGCENGYYLDGPLEYLRVASDMRGWLSPCARLIAPENREKWRSRGQAGFGFYLDMYVNEPGNRYYRGPKVGGTRLDHLRDNLTAALGAADQYVWVYGEQCRWWKDMSAKQLSNAGSLEKTVGKGRLWEETMPGLPAVIQQVRDPLAHAKAFIARNKPENLAQNGDFAKKAEKSALPDQFGSWQDDKSKGKFGWDDKVGDGSARASGVLAGCFIQSIPAKAGQAFYIQADAKATGSSVASLMIRWQKADSTWTRWDVDQTFNFSGQGEWRQSGGVVTVPRDAEKLVVLLEAHNQLSADDVVWFDNLKVYRIAD
ncbi:MAG: hypothetical protein ABSH20_04640 [Tepidisphaeraceae bacterium]|jgi:hypothetical protein